MSDKKMLQAILDGQASIRDEVEKLRKGTEAGFEKVHERLDAIGNIVAYLEDDAPTREEHNELAGRVTKIENKLQI